MTRRGFIGAITAILPAIKFIKLPEPKQAFPGVKVGPGDFHLPPPYGKPGQVLITDGTGFLSWEHPRCRSAIL